MLGIINAIIHLILFVGPCVAVALLPIAYNDYVCDIVSHTPFSSVYLLKDVSISIKTCLVFRTL